MSVTLTNRDTATLVLTQTGVTKDGILYSAAGQTLADQRSAMARFTNTKGVSGNARSNFRLERRVRDAAGKVWLYACDITATVPNGGPLTIDDIDDDVTSACNYFSSATESQVGDFVQGQPRV